MRNPGKLNKKGISMILVMSTLAIITILIATIIIYKFFQTAKEKLEIQDCKNSVAAHAILTKTSQREIFTDIKCRTREILIDVKNHQKAKKIIAEDMRRCWYEWQKGNAQLFKGEGIFCHICSVYSFKQKDQEIKDFSTFLLSENIDIRSLYPEDTQKTTYMQYFQGYTTEQIDEIEKLPKSGEFKDTALINTSKKYTTIFVYVSGKDEIEEFLEGGGRTTMLGAGVMSIVGGIIAGAGAIMGVSFMASNPAGWIIGAVIAIGTGIIAVYNALTPEDPQWMAFIQFMEYNATQIKELGCQYLEANQLSHQKP